MSGLAYSARWLADAAERASSCIDSFVSVTTWTASRANSSPRVKSPANSLPRALTRSTYVGWSRVVAVGVLDTDSEVSVRRRMMRDDENEEVYDKRDSIMKMNVAKTTTSDDNYFG